jgi:hypothetical protein
MSDRNYNSTKIAIPAMSHNRLILNFKTRCDSRSGYGGGRPLATAHEFFGRVEINRLIAA